MGADDASLAFLLDLHGEEIVYESGHVARFRARRVAATANRPHGIVYALTFHAPDGRRLVGFDNAHPVDPIGSRFAKRRSVHDHWHRDERDEGRPYVFRDAATLIGDFFDAIERHLKESAKDG